MSIVKYIYLVDDDTDDQEFFVEAIRGLQNVHLYGLANNGKEALDQLFNSGMLPDYIFMDFNMPVMNGIECLAELIKKPITKNIPVFMLSTASEQSELCKKLGAKGFIKKSADMNALRNQLDSIIVKNLTINFVVTDEDCVKQHSSR